MVQASICTLIGICIHIHVGTWIIVYYHFNKQMDTVQNINANLTLYKRSFIFFHP